MKLAVSNIAWKPEYEFDALKLLAHHGVEHIEVAPSLIFPDIDPIEVSLSRITTTKEKYNAQGFSIVAMQALLFGHPELSIFGTADLRETMVSRLESIIEIAGLIGDDVKVVFGSPKNRLTGELKRDAVLEISRYFFRRLGDAAKKACVKFCLEPNAIGYGTDFAVTMAETVDIIKGVGHPSVGINVDAGVMAMNGENILDSLTLAKPFINHIHISEPYLDYIPNNHTDHQKVAAALQKICWDGVVSIEMKSGISEDDIKALDDSIRFVKRVYFQ